MQIFELPFDRLNDTIHLSKSDIMWSRYRQSVRSWITNRGKKCLFWLSKYPVPHRRYSEGVFSRQLDCVRLYIQLHQSDTRDGIAFERISYLSIYLYDWCPNEIVGLHAGSGVFDADRILFAFLKIQLSWVISTRDIPISRRFTAIALLSIIQFTMKNPSFIF